MLTLEYGEAMPAEARSGHGFPVFGSNGEVGRHQKFLIAEPGIIVGRKGSVGKVTWSDEPFWPIDTTYWVKCALEDRRWIYWMLTWLPLARLDTSTGVPGLNRNDVYSLTVHRPGSSERKKIAEVLDTLDTAIQQTEAIIAKLKAVKQGLLHDLLTRGIDANGELRPPQAEAPHLYKESPLGWIPKEWDFLALSKRLKRITYGFTNPMPTTDDGPWMLTAADISGGRIQYSTARHTSPKAFQQLSAKSRPELGSVLITKDGTLGRVAVVDQEGLCVNQSVAVLSPLSSTDSIYLSTFLQSHIGQDRMMADAGGSTIRHLYITKLADMEIPWPSEGEAAQIIVQVSAMTDRVDLEQQLLRKLTNEKSGLMDDLLTGRVRVTPLLAEAAQQKGSA